MTECNCKKNLVLDIVCDAEKYEPKYANETDACMDIKAKLNEGKVLHIEPGETKLIYTGLKVKIPEGHVMRMYVRSSVGIKKRCFLANGTGIIDAGYRDEIIVALTNHSKDTVARFEDGDRIAQFEITAVPHITTHLVSDDEEFRSGDRGGGIGSTGTK